MSLQRADRDLPALTVLALLMTGPRHTYEMHRLMVDTHKDFVTGLPRSMYHAVERLLRAELIEVVRTDRTEGRPERTVYGLTDAGRAELVERVRRLLEHPDPDATLFVAALSFLACLPVPQARAALDVRRAELHRRIDGARAALAEVVHLPRLLLVETEFEIARLAAERDWVAGLLADIDSGRLDWPADIRELEVPPVT
ncbi:DNA-binding PadR family transcriptional regulator [Pseudonocardia hierapolitana]|uniref:DNA-binding PadR family transcriptional regulator n=1 Tax=Pseudonocardia hierapolitana TaxID=1128676 RepID=A0A561SWB6_9PSEU|nr:PadR family transcriptional regulator [Pseudonocardia hierapolitana]TWF79148.1 DNA-binding PadR family transcriptional regulator [Pseudonocardia hierapolitana]